ncbi:MAG: H/ACA RNA-protein complex protein Gar1 [Candidatus Lokiarchaeota archaeon]|nr:H/ACA RNA-protein complex protein Gar1 [Candidatus Lokiarchaeota archaeon]
MRRLGTALHISTRGSLIVRCKKTPPIGGEVVDKEITFVGTIIDVFGPVNSPYIAIRAEPSKKSGNEPNSGDKRGSLEEFVGKVMYLYRK